MMPPNKHSTKPAWLEEFQLHYGESLSCPTKRAFAEAMDEFDELSPGRQRFMLLHMTGLLVQSNAHAHSARGRIHRTILALGDLMARDGSGHEVDDEDVLDDPATDSGGAPAVDAAKATDAGGGQ